MNYEFLYLDMFHVCLRGAEREPYISASLPFLSNCVMCMLDLDRNVTA